MSLLADLLSRIKRSDNLRDVPPGLKNTMDSVRKKDSVRRLAIISLAALALMVGTGFFTVYGLRTFLAGSDLKGPNRIMRDLPPTSPGAGRGVEDAAVAQTAQTPPPAEEHKAGQQTLSRFKEHESPSGIQKKKSGRAAALESKISEGTIKAGPPGPVRDGHGKEAIDIPSQVADLPLNEKQDADPSEKDMYLYRSGQYEAAGDLMRAVAGYKKVLDIEPSNYRVMNKIAALFIRLGLLEEAAKYLKQALNARPDYLHALINSGIVAAKTGDFAAAERHLLKALSLDSMSTGALSNIVLLYERQGRHELARQDYDKLKALGYHEGFMGPSR
ncbi:MAG: tetratricopeptide repeat protein [Nitrospirae bacterium]|nr:tetratricopeptide repeat protein [Nitrospirota bacterium]